LGVVSYFLTTELFIKQNLFGIGGALGNAGTNYNIAVVALGVILWLVMTTIGYFIVALIVGKDPDPMSAQNIPMRPRTIKKK
jgi:phage shock protein PspC (stress-responsive transcriptional regulator)